MKMSLNFAKKVCLDIGSDIFIISLAKRLDRDLGNKVSYTSDGREIFLDKSMKLKQFLQTLRDEIHRFAITSHRKKCNIRMLVSILDNIPSIGEEKNIATVFWIIGWDKACIYKRITVRKWHQQ